MKYHTSWNCSKAEIVKNLANNAESGSFLTYLLVLYSEWLRYRYKSAFNRKNRWDLIKAQCIVINSVFYWTITDEISTGLQ